jgi:transcription antitermination factor NusG
MSERWVAVAVMGGREAWAAINVERQGARAYAPMLPPKKDRPRPLFPGYIFAHIAERWRFLQGTFGVRQVVMCGAYPAIVPPGLVDGLRASEDKRGFIVLPELSTAKFRQGDRIRVRLGYPFGGELVVYQGDAPAQRARVLLDLLGRKTAMSIPENHLEDVPELVA